MKKFFICLTSLIIFLPLQISSQETEPVYINFDLPTISTYNIKLSDIVGGKLVLLVFWTTWCPYCKISLPRLSQVYEKYHRDGLEIIAVNIREPNKAVKKFVETYNLPYLITIDNSGNVAKQYQIKGVPTYVLISTSGKIIYQNYLFPSEELIVKNLPKLIQPKNVKTKQKSKKR